MKRKAARWGVLALQGCVQPHRAHIESLGAALVEVRDRETLESVDGLILPGGESTTMLKLIDHLGLEQPLRKAFERIPFWGICAGAILMARQVVSPEQRSFALLDIEIERNAYGRQQESFHAEVGGYLVSFIRAPQIRSVGKNIQVLAYLNTSAQQQPIWVQSARSSGRAMVTTFHPELSPNAPSPMHQKFYELMRAS